MQADMIHQSVVGLNRNTWVTMALSARSLSRVQDVRSMLNIQAHFLASKTNEATFRVFVSEENNNKWWVWVIVYTLNQL